MNTSLLSTKLRKALSIQWKMMESCLVQLKYHTNTQAQTYGQSSCFSVHLYQVYEAVFCMTIRDYKKAADLFLDATATFAT